MHVFFGLSLTGGLSAAWLWSGFVARTYGL